ncbi:MAG TPA: gliding motility-associated ABC transporter substrate-binding protein GldG [Cytophagaceae bacterium]|jgi:ABC-2 type transport system permease protein|nr:gliding motility-associated ABC transporter substrate-binding protein GldG [Cytophagaceae bacterium]
MKKRGIHITEFFLTVGIIILMNIIFSQYFFRVDLTEDKRYTISQASKDVLHDLDDVVYIRVFLAGDLPGGFKRLEKSVKEMLDEFRIYGGDKIQYEFIDLMAETDPQMRSRMINQVTMRGVQPTNVYEKGKEGNIEKLIFPGALISYKKKEVPVLLLKGNKAAGSAEILNQSVEGLEFELTSAIKQLVMKKRKSIAFVEGHGEYPGKNLEDIAQGISKYYDVYTVNLSKVKNLDIYDGLIIARPQTEFSEQEKFIIDQFIMNGSKVLFYLDALKIDLDSLAKGPTVAVSYNYNLDDLLFKYGVRVNQTLVQDLNSGYIPMNVGTVGDKPEIKMVSWRYFPLLNTFSNHPIVKNMDAVYSKFVANIDTVKATGIKKTPLVLTSKYSRVYTAPVMVDLEQARKKADPADYKQGNIPVYYLLEGSFTSLYKNRPLPVQNSKFMEQGKATKLIVCSDADIIKNETDQNGRTLPLGYDRATQQTFGNKDLVMNSLNYLLDEDGVIDIRAKEVALRPLDKIKLRDDSTDWQIINLVLPVLLVVVFGIARHYIRKRKYESFK